MADQSHAGLAFLTIGLVAAIGALVWYETSQGASDDLSDVADSDGSGGGVISAIQNLGVDTVGALSRGIRDNNPGNIEGNGGFNGQTGVDSANYATFDSMQDGIRAIAVIIKNYSALYGLNTVRAIITRWSATDQAAYVANVAAALGVDPDDSIDVSDPTTLSGIVNAIIVQENGQLLAATIPSTDITNGIASA